MPQTLEGDRPLSQGIMPTQRCFDDALDILVELLTVEHVPPTELRLVHAICLVPDDGTPFAHAWVERACPWMVSRAGSGRGPSRGTECLFLGLYQGARVLCRVERAAYYAYLRVQHRTKYTPWQAQRENERTNTYGPWQARYLALCTPRTPDAAGAP